MAPASDVCTERNVQQIVGVSEVQHPIEHEAVAETSPDAFSTPLMRPLFGQSMHQYLEQLRPSLDLSQFARVSSMEEDGLYLHKRHIRGDHGKMLEQAGTALLHTIVYLKSGKKIVSLDFGPVGDADVTANLTEAVPCGPVVHDSAEQPRDTVELPFLHIKVPHHPADSEVLSKAVKFSQSRLYHTFANNCIQNTDLFIRALTGGEIRNAPLVYDALCGHVPAQDNPMLVMFMLMTGISWFDVCDGSHAAAAFLKEHSKPAVPS
ncbi:g5551 [Coccomyxa elongata]